MSARPCFSAAAPEACVPSAKARPQVPSRPAPIRRRPRAAGEVSFVPLRDRYGVTQLLLQGGEGEGEGEGEGVADLRDVPVDSVVSVEGVVRARPAGMRNDAMPTGEVEVVVRALRVLNGVQRSLPSSLCSTGFGLPEGKAKEELRLRNRYLDLRRPQMQARDAGARTVPRTRATRRTRPAQWRTRTQMAQAPPPPPTPTRPDRDRTHTRAPGP